MEKQFPYTTLLDIRYGHGELIDLPAIVNTVRDKWFNQTLTKVNDSVVRLGIVEGEYHWHKHDKDDEFFFVRLAPYPGNQKDGYAHGGDQRDPACRRLAYRCCLAGIPPLDCRNPVSPGPFCVINFEL